jgi:hypothetical protein
MRIFIHKRGGCVTAVTLLPEARHVVLPVGITGSEFGEVEEQCARVGLEFDRWQKDLNWAILSLRGDGLYATDTVVLSIPRQVGKTWDVGAIVFADSIVNAGTLTVWTAHHFKVARESFNEMRRWASTPRMLEHVDYTKITTAAGNEAIPFRNGSRIVFAARERGAIRGFTKVRRLILDEGQILTDDALADLLPTMNQASNPQAIIMGTPPKPTDPSEVFARLRADALNGVSDDVLFVEFSAPADSDLDDRVALGVANPSYPLRTGERSIVRLRKWLTDDDFRREVFGIWDGTLVGLFNPAEWAAAADLESEPLAPLRYGIEVSAGRAWSTLGVAGYRADDLVHLAVQPSEPGTDWVADRCVDLWDRHPDCSFVIDGTAGPAESLIPALETAGVPLTVLSAADVRKATAMLVDAVHDGTIRHRAQTELTRAVEDAIPRSAGDGGFAFSRKNSKSNISPLNAVCWAHYVTVLAGPGDIFGEFGLERPEAGEGSADGSLGDDSA